MYVMTFLIIGTFAAVVGGVTALVLWIARCGRSAK